MSTSVGGGLEEQHTTLPAEEAAAQRHHGESGGRLGAGQLKMERGGSLVDGDDALVDGALVDGSGALADGSGMDGGADVNKHSPISGPQQLELGPMHPLHQAGAGDVVNGSGGVSEFELARRLGVRFDSSNAAWVARWTDTQNDRKKSRWFSIAKYGNSSARRLAIQACLSNMKPSDFPSLRDLHDVINNFTAQAAPAAAGGPYLADAGGNPVRDQMAQFAPAAAAYHHHHHPHHAHAHAHILAAAAHHHGAAFGIHPGMNPAMASYMAAAALPPHMKAHFEQQQQALLKAQYEQTTTAGSSTSSPAAKHHHQQLLEAAASAVGGGLLVEPSSNHHNLDPNVVGGGDDDDEDDDDDNNNKLDDDPAQLHHHHHHQSSSHHHHHHQHDELDGRENDDDDGRRGGGPVGGTDGTLQAPADESNGTAAFLQATTTLAPPSSAEAAGGGGVQHPPDSASSAGSRFALSGASSSSDDDESPSVGAGGIGGGADASADEEEGGTDDDDDDDDGDDVGGDDDEGKEGKRKKRKLDGTGAEDVPTSPQISAAGAALGYGLYGQPPSGQTTGQQQQALQAMAMAGHIHPSYYSLYPGFQHPQQMMLHAAQTMNGGPSGHVHGLGPFLLQPPSMFPMVAHPHFQAHQAAAAAAAAGFLPHLQGAAHYGQGGASPTGDGGGDQSGGVYKRHHHHGHSGSQSSSSSGGGGGAAAAASSAKMTCERGLHYSKNYQGNQECWIAVWNTKGGRIMHEAFDVGDLGYEGAKQKAREARDAAHSNNVAVTENSRPSWKSHSNTGIPHVSLDSQQLRFRAHKFGRRLCRSFSFGRRRGSYASRESAFDAAVLWLIQTPTDEEIAQVSGCSSKVDDV